jgi:hypothetical protein
LQISEVCRVHGKQQIDVGEPVTRDLTWNVVDLVPVLREDGDGSAVCLSADVPIAGTR